MIKVPPARRFDTRRVLLKIPVFVLFVLIERCQELRLLLFFFQVKPLVVWEAILPVRVL